MLFINSHAFSMVVPFFKILLECQFFPEMFKQVTSIRLFKHGPFFLFWGGGGGGGGGGGIYRGILYSMGNRQVGIPTPTK